MNARKLTWRFLVPLSLAIFLLVALSQLRPELELYPGIADGAASAAAPLVGPAWKPLLERADSTEPVRIHFGKSDGLLWILSEGPEKPSRAELRKLDELLRRFDADLILVEHAQGSYLPIFSRPENSFGAQGYLRRWAEERDVPVAHWRKSAEDPGDPNEELTRVLAKLQPSLASGRRAVLAVSAASGGALGRDG